MTGIKNIHCQKKNEWIQGCALAAPGRLRRLTFGLGRLKKKSGRPSGRIDFGLCENPKRNQQTYRNGTERNKKKLHRAPRLPLARKAKALKAQCNQFLHKHVLKI